MYNYTKVAERLKISVLENLKGEKMEKRVWFGTTEYSDLLKKVVGEYAVSTIDDRIRIVEPGTELTPCCSMTGKTWRPVVHIGTKGEKEEADFAIVVGDLPINDSARDLAFENNLPYPDVMVANDYFDLRQRL